MNDFRTVFVTDTPAPSGRLLWAKACRILSPYWGCCLRCGAPWNHAEPKTTRVGPGSGCFPLCTTCWPELTNEQRLPYYKHLMTLWRKSSDGEHPPEGYEEMLFLAVMTGG